MTVAVQAQRHDRTGTLVTASDAGKRLLEHAEVDCGQIERQESAGTQEIARFLAETAHVERPDGVDAA